MTHISKIVWYLYVSLVDKFINHIYGCMVQRTLGFNPLWGKMGRPCFNVSKKVWHMYIIHMLLEISFAFLSMDVGLNCPL